MCLVLPFVRYVNLLSVSGHLVTLKFRKSHFLLTLLSHGWMTQFSSRSFALWWLKPTLSCSVVSDSLRPIGLSPAGLLCPWDSPGKNTGVGCHSSSRGSSQHMDGARTSSVSCTAGGFCACWVILAQLKPLCPCATSTYSCCSTQWGHFYMKL